MDLGMKEKLEAIFNSGVAAVAPDQALARSLSFANGVLKCAGKEYDLSTGRALVVGAGKGAAPMARELENMLGDIIEQGFVVVKYDHDLPMRVITCGQAAHPVPDNAGVEAASKILEIASECEPGDLLICLLTGGASALLPCPLIGLTLEDLAETTRLLLASGADIGELNAIRKHLSRISGGRLAAITRGQVLALIVSDVIGDDLGVIASGPTSPDPSTYGECLEIARKYHLEEKLPASVMEILIQGANGKLPETPKPGDACFKRVENVLVASNGQALAAAAGKARELGMDVIVMPEPMEGEASEVASSLIAFALEKRRLMKPADRPLCILAGGETTVKIRGEGIGGRNQEMALTAILELENMKGCAALFGGTDGTDGPTNAAGGFAFPDSAQKVGGIEAARRYLANNDSHNALKKSGDLLVTGPTRTNVMDLAVIIVEPPKSGS